MKKIIIIIFIIFPMKLIFGQNTDSLDNYVQYASSHNPEVIVYQKNYEASLEKIDYLSGLPNPTLSFGYFISPVETRNGPQLGKVSVSQMFPWFGTLSAREKQAAILSNSLYNKYIDKQYEISYKTRKAYFNIYFLTKKKELISHQIELFKKLEQEALIKLQTNKSTSIDVLVFQMAVEELQINFENIEAEILKYQVNFNLILNRNGNKEVFLLDTIELGEMRIFMEDSILQNNFKIKASDDMLTMYNYKYKADRLSTFPKFGLGLDYVFIGQDASLPSSGKDAIMPMVSISLPIWGRKNKSLNSSNKILIEQAEQQKVATENNLSTKYQNVKYNGSSSAKNAQSLYLCTKAQVLGQKRRQENYIVKKL